MWQGDPNAVYFCCEVNLNEDANTMTPQTKKLDIHAARLCQAIARIGYEPQIALMDIVDNAVTARASTIRISLFLAPGKTLKNRNSVRKYQVVDDGAGMTEAEVTAAFALGSNGNYAKKSLSKYGMGLKSAGLSLGTRIHIVSKKNNKLSSRQTFDIDLIAEKDDFIISVNTLAKDEIAYYGKLLPGKSGTVVEIDGCETVNHQSSGTTVRKLEDTMGVVYAYFLSNVETPLSIGIRVCANDEPNFKIIEPLDILFRDGPLPVKGWDPETYDFVSPYLLLDDDWTPDLGDGKDVPTIRLSAVAFPRDSMGKPGSPLSPMEQKFVKGYQISRANAGCFIYRNGRLIRWADDLGFLTKDEYNIRIRMDLTEEHDDVLHVDVTKQRLEIDDELLARLKRILDDPRATAKLIMKKCSERLKKPTGSEGAAFTELSANVAEDDPEELASGEPTEEVLERQQAQAVEAQAITASTTTTGGAAPSDLVSTVAAFAKVRYTSDVAYQHLWAPYRDAKQGVFVCINTNHPFYIEFMAALADNASERLLLESLIFAAAVAEINTVGNLYDVEIDLIKSVFSRFHKNCGQYLANFTSENINLLNE
ncbi:ATP-binding protein [Paraburkholderia hospita]|uniref:ATP-binding protein n=1 Tax=Paraburkholderia hospita TaxID=169430 RepID=UPI003ECD6265